MKLTKVIISMLLMVFSLSGFAAVSVRGYTRQDGTHVQPYHRSNPDGNPNNNWSTKGNTNPYTGKEGSHEPQQNNRLNSNY